MTDALLVALAGAIFNAGVMWGTLRAIVGRVKRAEESGVRAHDRIDKHLESHA